MQDKPSSPVVVGIDGSEAAANAAIWAATEAAERDVPLRLVHVIPTSDVPILPEGSLELEQEYAETALRHVTAAVEEIGLPVKLETAVARGPIDTVLIRESRDAVLVCVGSVGIGAVATRLLGSTAVSLAENAHCPVAVVRIPHRKPLSGIDWIVVGVDDSPQTNTVVEYALNEARRRHAPVLAVGTWSEDLGETPYDEVDARVQHWQDTHRDVHIYPVATRAHVARFLADNVDESIQLAVIGAGDVRQMAAIIGPRRHPIVSHGYCSVLVVR